KVRKRDAGEGRNARGVEFRLAGTVAAGYPLRAAHAAQVSRVRGGGHSHAGVGHWRKHGYFQLDRCGDAAVAAGGESLSIGTSQMGSAQRAKHSLVHDSWRLPSEPE